MSFIGVISNKKNFDSIKNELIKFDNNISLIHISLKSIANIKNIKFEIIIIDEKIEKFDNYKLSLQKICKESKYIIINSDLNKDYKCLKSSSNLIITFGLNREANITISSISDTDILIYRQKSFENKYSKMLEIEERRVEINPENRLRVYEMLIIYAFSSIFSKVNVWKNQLNFNNL